MAFTSVASAGPSAVGAWTVAKGPNAGIYNSFWGVARLSSRDAWAVGNWSNHQLNHYHVLMAHWDGRSWQPVDPPDAPDPESGLFAIAASSPSDIWAVGGQGNNLLRHPTSRTLIEHFDGTSWSVVPSPSPGAYTWLSAVSASSPDDAWAVGETFRRRGDRSLALHWDGSKWSVINTPPAASHSVSFTGVAQTSQTDAWIVGWYLQHQRTQALVEHWDGEAWSIVKSPRGGPSDMLNGVTAVSPDNAWAVGGSNTDPEGRIPLAEHWDGTSWSLVPVPKPQSGIVLRAVSAAASGDVWAVGEFGHAVARTAYEHWDGSRWSLVSAPDPRKGREEIDGISAGVDGAMAVGSYAPNIFRSPSRTLIEMCCS
jgi:hypothetical protein